MWEKMGIKHSESLTGYSYDKKWKINCNNVMWTHGCKAIVQEVELEVGIGATTKNSSPKAVLK